MIEIIPAIDLIDGRCVRLAQGDFAQATKYADDPVATARSFEAAGIKRLHIVDLDGARAGKLMNLLVLEAIAKATDLVIDFGGGIKTTDDLRAAYDAGAALVNIGSVAVKSPDKVFTWLDHYGSEKLLLGADVRRNLLAIDGWQTATVLEIGPFLVEYFAKGVRQAAVTEISKDGMLKGPAFDLYSDIRQSLPDLRLVASGGVSTIGDIQQLDDLGCAGVIIGRALYEGKIALKELSVYAR